MLQETFSYPLGKVPGFVLSAKMTTFLYLVVKNLSAAARDKRMRLASGGALLDTAITDPVPGDASQELAAVLSMLSDRQREVLLLRFVDDFSLAFTLVFAVTVAVISLHLGCTMSTAMMQPRSAFCDRSEATMCRAAASAADRPGDVVAEPKSEELLVIEKHPGEIPRDMHDDTTPGTGSMLAKRGTGANPLVPIPLKHTDVKASVAGYIVSVEVTQQFQDPYDDKIEAVYVFPLPQNAAVNDFIMTIGTRHIRGIIRDRQEAERIYHEARSQGYVATLLTQERPNIFTQSVANMSRARKSTSTSNASTHSNA